MSQHLAAPEAQRQLAVVPSPAHSVDQTRTRLEELRRDRAVLRVVSALRAAGVRPLVLSAIAAHAIEDPTELLVAPRERRAAERVLRRLGYRRERAGRWHEAGLTPVVLHRRFSSAGVRRALAWVLVDRHRTDRSLGGGSIDVLDLPGRLVHVAIKAHRDDAFRAELRTLADLVTADDRFRAVELARNLRVTEPVGAALTTVGRPEIAAWFAGW